MAQFPSFAPLLEEIELAGWSSHRRLLSGNFHDWMLLADGRIVVMAGKASGPDPTVAALISQAAWATLRAHALHLRDAGELLSFASRSLWPSMAGAQSSATVTVAYVDPDGGRVSLAMAGKCFVWRVRAATIDQLWYQQPGLGAASEFAYRAREFELSLRERLLLVAGTTAGHTDEFVSSIEATFAAQSAESHRRMTAADAMTLARRHFENEAKIDMPMTASIVAVRRR
jgi:hypothetical protein